jgi:hypothetical protein
MPSKKKPATTELNVPKELLDELVKGPMTQDGVEAVCRSLKKAVIERAMNAEMSDHLGYGMNKKAATILSLAALAVVAIWLILSRRQEIEADGTLAYVASADKKVYALDLRRGLVVRASAPLDEMGRPTSIAYVAAEPMLLVASERGRGENDYSPLVAIRPGPDLVLARTYTVGAGGELRRDAPNTSRHAIYTVVAAQDGRTLYLGLAEPNGQLTTLFDTATGAITGRSSVHIGAGSYISPDGTQVADIWPSGSRTVDAGGQPAVQEWPGGVVVRDIATGNVVSRTDLRDNQGLHPPWSVVAGPYLYIKPGTTELRVYDRVTGNVDAMIELRALTNMTPTQPVPMAVPDSTLAALSMVDADGRGFVTVIDLASRQVKSSIPVGPSPTNVVLASETE